MLSLEAKILQDYSISKGEFFLTSKNQSNNQQASKSSFQVNKY